MQVLAGSAEVARWFLPFVLPLCFAAAYTDLSRMRIPNWITDSLGAVYVILGLLIMPTWADYGWQLLHLPIGIAIGFLFYSAGVMGAGDAKFIGAAAPLVVYAANLLAAFATHRLAKHTPLSRLAPGWQSWSVGKKFPMGFSLGGTLALYLILVACFGQ
jgi:prepilin peptidase CpaA